jgi:hypothetical protein
LRGWITRFVRLSRDSFCVPNSALHRLNMSLVVWHIVYVKGLTPRKTSAKRHCFYILNLHQLTMY